MEQTFSCAACKKEYPASQHNNGYAYPATETSNKWYTDYIAYAVNRQAIVLPVCTPCVKKEMRPIIILFITLIVLGLAIMICGAIFHWGKWGWMIGLILLGCSLMLVLNGWLSRELSADTIAVRTIFNSLSRRDQKNEKARLFTRQDRSKLR